MRFAGIVFAAGLLIPATGCGSYWEGDQWAGVTDINNTGRAVTLDLYRSRNLSPGQKTLLGVDSSSNPQAFQIRGHSTITLKTFASTNHRSLTAPAIKNQLAGPWDSVW